MAGLRKALEVDSRTPLRIFICHTPTPSACSPLKSSVCCPAQCLAGFDEGVAQGVHFVCEIADVPFAARAMKGRGPPHVVFRFFEIGQHILPGPARIARRAPVVKIGGLPTDVDHGIDRAAAAQHLAARPVEVAMGQGRVGLGVVHPVVAGV